MLFAVSVFGCGVVRGTLVCSAIVCAETALHAQSASLSKSDFSAQEPSVVSEFARSYPEPFQDEVSGSAMAASAQPGAASETGEKKSEAVKNASVGLGGSTNTTPINENVYYKNRLEFSLDVGWLPINIPFVFDVFLGDGYTMAPLRYTLVPIVGSLRWNIDDVEGAWIFRGNWDVTFSGSVTPIPRGPETDYFSYDMGVRRNFVPHHGKIAPYFDGRLGLGRIDAKGPIGVLYAQGQNFTFTVNLGSGVRWNVNSRYSISAGLNWMHISNLYLSEPKFANYGINVYGPMFGLGVRLGKPRHYGSE